jgi:Na+/H+-dicarboxylate symporter
VQNSEHSSRSKFSLTARILVALLVGVGAGFALGPRAAPFGELGKLIIQLIKAVATPLLFLSVTQAVLKTELTWRAGLRMMIIALLNASIALAIGLSLTNYFQPGQHLQREAVASLAARAAPVPVAAGMPTQLDFMKALSGFVPVSLVQPFVENAILPLVLVSLLVGFGLRRARLTEAAADVELLERGLHAALKAVEAILGWIVQLVPFAVFGVVAKATGEYGLDPLKGLAAYLGVGLLGLSLQVFVVYQMWIRLVIGMPLGFFWRHARETVVYALGANSSLVSLPLTLRTLRRLGVSDASANLGACVGTNFNNDGIILYEAMAVLFVAQAHGFHLTLGQQLLAALSCLVAAMGIAGIPEAGFISLALVLGTVGLPAELLPLLLTVDWIVARARSAVNVLADMTVSMLIERWETGPWRPDGAGEEAAEGGL